MKYLTWASKGRRIYFDSWWRIRLILVRQEWSPECEAVGHVAAMVKNQRLTDVRARLTSRFPSFPSYSVLVPEPRMALPTCRVGLSFLVKCFWKHSPHALRCVFQATLDTVKLTRKTNTFVAVFRVV